LDIHLAHFPKVARHYDTRTSSALLTRQRTINSSLTSNEQDQNNNMTMNSLPSLLILLIAAVACSSSVDAGTASQQKMIQPRTGALKFQALHQMFSIGDDHPNEAIHTNILINMEGL
jgi:hypothetical protein